KFNQIVEKYLRSLTKSEKSVITEETAQQIIHLIENDFKDSTVD
ncbi:10573_t:CDS:1, partial [Paraglomus brasilianum]